MTWVFIEPTDVWFFRDAKPFAAGEGHTARSFFPPSPQTLTGALRSLILGARNVDWGDFQRGQGPGVAEVSALIGTPETLGNTFAMRGPFLARRMEDGNVEQCVPMPADAYQLENRMPVTFGSFKPSRTKFFEADHNWPKALHPLWPPDGQRQEGVEGAFWLADVPLQEYLEGGTFGAEAAEAFFVTEPRIGIALDYTYRRPQDQMLYNAHYVRPKSGIGLLLWLDDRVPLPASEGWLSLGGEARAGRYETLSPGQVEAVQNLKVPQNRVKIVLLTPAYFTGGWQPADGKWEKVFGQSADLIAVAIHQPRHIGGWDLARGGHKDMHAYVPPGSVYYFEFDTPIQALSKPFTQSPVVPTKSGDEPAEHTWFKNGNTARLHPFAQMGFGQAVLGTWDWQI